MKKVFILWSAFTLLLGFQSAFAHFGMVIPSDSMVMQKENKTIQLVFAFAHPFERVGMELVKPAVRLYLQENEQKDLGKALHAVKLFGQTAWRAAYRINKPGSYWFVMEPEPYWESAEDCFIIHYTKTMVTAYGDDEGWDRELGLKTEIVPLSKPFGLYTGNIFQGIVKLKGKVVPNAEVEVEYFNRDGKGKAPTDYMITQTIKADINGVFSYAAPKSGWWGFAALNEADYKLKQGSQMKSVELGAVLWVQFHDWVKY
jgi:nickel transport protein